MDVDRQIKYWRAGAEEDIKAAKVLCQSKLYRQSLFFGHLAIEKILKAHVCKTSREFAPKIHNLIQLSTKLEMQLSEQYLELLADMNKYNLAGRYPHHSNKRKIGSAECKKYLKMSEGIFKWLAQRLEKTSENI